MRSTAALRIALVSSMLSCALPVSAQEADELSSPVSGHHIDHGLLAAGTFTFSAAWGIGSVGAFATLDNHTPGVDPELGFGGELVRSLGWDGAYGVSLIPIAGPILSATVALTEPIPAFILGSLAIVGAAAQAVGIGLMIAGLFGVDEPMPEVAEGVRVLPIASADHASLLVSVEL